MKFFAVLAVAGLATAIPQSKGSGGLGGALSSMLSGLGITVPNMPSCAMSCVQDMFKATGCSLNSGVAGCVCKSPALIKTNSECIPKACTSAADVKAFADTMNGQCKGKPGFTGI